MEQNGKILSQLVNFVKEQKQMNKEQKQMNRDQKRFGASLRRMILNQEKTLSEMRKDSKKMTIYFEKRLQLHYRFLIEQREWLKNHEVRLRNIEKN